MIAIPTIFLYTCIIDAMDLLLLVRWLIKKHVIINIFTLEYNGLVGKTLGVACPRPRGQAR